MASGVMLSLAELLNRDNNQLIGELTIAFASTGFEVQRTLQVEVWGREISYLREVARCLIDQDAAFAAWHLVLEYEIPRRQKRPDGILLDSDMLFVLEFKLGASRAGFSGRWQVEDYALDLRDFHEASRARTIVPVLCVERNDNGEQTPSAKPTGPVWPVCTCSVSALAELLQGVYDRASDPSQDQINPDAWYSSAYRPTLSIIEAAEQLFSQQDVREISHSYADNLTTTTAAIVEHIRQAQQRKERRICFITGVPGAGKTLTGLNAVHDPQIRGEGRSQSVFLSGNGPLVKIIKAALVRSCQRRGVNRRQAEHEVTAFIQNVHAFIRQYVKEGDARPTENVIVFDEAQRAWDADQMARRQNVRASEPELLLRVMERCPDWCVVVALVGGGQEIHEGEAGLTAWGAALASRQGRWTVAAPEEALRGDATVAGSSLLPEGQTMACALLQDDRLHLRVSTRTYRAHRFNDWVNDVLALRPKSAAEGFAALHDFPVVTTRDLHTARQWLRQRNDLEPSRRCGLVASSGALRLRAYGLELSSDFRRGYPYDDWFLAPAEDVRSSHRLEVAATEFECQGLELDWVGICWGNDLSIGPDGQWSFRRFRGSRWDMLKNPAKQQYLLNKYRVLLTRARLGIVIWIPPGNADDQTLDTSVFNRIYDYLRFCGVPAIAS